MFYGPLLGYDKTTEKEERRRKEEEEVWPDGGVRKTAIFSAVFLFFPQKTRLCPSLEQRFGSLGLKIMMSFNLCKNW